MRMEPASAHSPSASWLNEIIGVCDRFEAAWEAGTPRPIEQELEGVNEELRSCLLGQLLALEVELRRERGECPSMQEYFARFPGQEDLVQAAFPTADPGDSTPLLHPQPEPPPPPDLPVRIGRYRIVRLAGRGGFGLVYLSHDEQLDRPVAVKVPHAHRVSRPEDAEPYLVEARTVAGLDHPHIVPVYDVGSTDQFPLFVVSKFIDGVDLKTRLHQRRPGPFESAGLVAIVAEALHYAHKRGLVHRDIKPGNILIDKGDKPFVVDFGLALREQDFGQGHRYAGTPAYMSPEQARREGHRVDGRSDLFSLGVVFYELLTGRRPFIARAQDKDEAVHELLDLIATTEARPPRQIEDMIPKELERICLKAISKRATDRYTTARDMAEDLRAFLQAAGGTTIPVPSAVGTSPAPSTQEATQVPTIFRPSDSDQRPVKIIPKGLRSFDEQDANFYLELLPGPRDRDGLPESIRFWKTRIEQIDPDKTFRVGLIYGPSGCGKSSMVKAGLLPRLGKHVLSVYIEATAEDTENWLLRGPRKVCPDLPEGLGLVNALALLRQGRVLRSGQKVLIVLDQFEQWLHAKRGEENAELVAALRQCDGEHVQTIVMVRDDFWMAATRFMDALEVELLQGQNTAAVDLFDPRHARKVLTAFGIAYGNLPERSDDLSRDQHAFLDRAITELAQDGKVISVRLALFAEMMKGKPWTPAILREVGGAEGVGVAFLEDTFSSPQANPKHRLHQRAAQAVLKSLLPETGTAIKGQMRSKQDLRNASGYADRPRDFSDLLHILDAELRLITPTDPEGFDDDRSLTKPGELAYQLTHDYLVPSLRDWLSYKQRQTRRGRAEIRLAEAAKLWGASPKSQTLPNFSEWLSILVLTNRDKWTLLERRMLRAATRRYRTSALSALLLVALSCVLPFVGGQYIRASLLADEYRVASNLGAKDNLNIIDEMKTCRYWIDAILQRKLVEAKRDNDKVGVLRYSAALIPTHPDMLDSVYSKILPKKQVESYGTNYITSNEEGLAATVLQKYDPGFATRLWEIAADRKREIWHRYFAASKLATIDPSNARWSTIAPDLIADHDFASDPDLSFSEMGLVRMDARLRGCFREPLLRRIDRSSESSCPVRLLNDVFTPQETIDLIVEVYISGHFSLDSLKLSGIWIRRITEAYERKESVDLRKLFQKKSSNSFRERRRELVLSWLEETPWLTR